MASQLREVLNRFADQSAPVSIHRMAQDMGIEPNILSGMIDYWVRKGKLREVSGVGETCHTCGIKGACPYVITLPRSYELAGDDDTQSGPPCNCGHCSS